MGGFLLADGLLGVTLAASVMAAAQHGASGARTALIAGLTPPEERLDALASLRVLGHAGDAIGAAAGALVIQLDAGAAYAALIAVNALSYAVHAAAAARLPASSRGSGPAKARAARRCATPATSRSPRSAAS